MIQIEKIINFAKQYGYIDVEKIESWNSYECYRPIFSYESDYVIGPPYIILVRGDSIRMSTSDEAFQYLDQKVLQSK